MSPYASPVGVSDNEPQRNRELLGFALLHPNLRATLSVGWDEVRIPAFSQVGWACKNDYLCRYLCPSGKGFTNQACLKSFTTRTMS
jgi:hypothetical protein